MEFSFKHFNSFTPYEDYTFKIYCNSLETIFYTHENTSNLEYCKFKYNTFYHTSRSASGYQEGYNNISTARILISQAQNKLRVFL